MHPLHRVGCLCTPFHRRVAPDAVAHIDADLGDAALKMMQRNMSAQIVPAAGCLASFTPRS